MNVGLICFDYHMWMSSNGLESARTTAASACAGEVRIQKGTEEGNCCSFPRWRRGDVCFGNEQDEEKWKLTCTSCMYREFVQ
jgi:hypothetical protein